MSKIKCINCNSDEMIYLGQGKHSISSLIGKYNYLCKKCNRVMWSSEKEKSKYKWYKMKDYVKQWFEEDKQ